MCTRSMNLGCFCVGFFEVLMVSPFVPKTVVHGCCCLVGGAGCFSPNARLMPSDLSGHPAGARGPHDRASARSALGCSGMVRSRERSSHGRIYLSARQKVPCL
jgi:hypothetical protein